MVPLRPLATLVLFLVGCSSVGGRPDGDGGASGAGGSGNTGGDPTPLAGPCPDDLAIGHFEVSLVPAVDWNPAYSQFGGRVTNTFDPARPVEQMRSGACRLLVLPTSHCDAPCTESGTACVGTNQCVSLPIGRSVGTVTITGLSSPLSAEPLPSPPWYYKPIADYPPALPGAAITLHATGGDHPSFTLAGEGIEPLVFPAPTAMVRDNQPFAFTWTPPTAGRSRILAELDIAHGSSDGPEVVCDFADTGSAEVPAEIVHALFAHGTRGFPRLNLTRRTVDATSLGTGCVDFMVATFAQQPVEVEGVTTCNCNGAECDYIEPALRCPAGHTCRRDYSCD